MENPVLDKNLECIGKYNPKLKDALNNLPSLTNNFELVENELKESILVYNGNPLHTLEGAEAEAKNIFSATINNTAAIQVVYGIGLGYLFKEFCDNSRGIVILYEPNLEILRVTLELVDFSKELSKGNVKVVSDIDSLKELFGIIYTYKAIPSFVVLDSYKALFQEEIKEAVERIELIAGACKVEYNTLKLFIADSSKMMVKNLPYMFDEVPLHKFKDAFKNKTAIIVSAGPSLDNCVETIKKNRDKVVIFCVGTALKALIKNGITPDFLNVIELNDCSGQIEGVDLSEINLILEPYTNNSFHQVKAKRKFIFASNNVHANQSWAKLTNVDISPYNAKGTVSYEAAESARILGFSKIILVGQDLAFVNNQCYSKNSAYSELTYEINLESNQVEVKAKDMEKYIDSLLPINGIEKKQEFTEFASYKVGNLNKTLYSVKSITGEMIPTQGSYATFIDHFKTFAQENTDLDLINTSMVGAQIDGFKNLSIEEALKDVSPISQMPNLDEKLFLFDKKLILRNTGEELILMENLLDEFNTAQDYVYKYERDYIRHKGETAETIKYFKLLLSLYQKISFEYKSKSALFHTLAFNEELEVEFLLKLDDCSTSQHISLVYESLKRYYSFVGQKLVEIIKILGNLKEIMIESIDSEG